ncbi:MAG: hypothetical protein IJ282_05110 [Lachnospiraceae bacterium]|nr:hypothetical protein [Lachnospiraceae bacterium]
MYNIIKKYKILFLLQLICILLCLPKCFAQEELVYFQDGGNMSYGQEGMPYKSELISLNPGVYQFRVRADISKDASLYLNVCSEQGSFRGLRCNGANMFAGQEYLDFEVYVLQKDDRVYLQCDFNKTDYSALQSMELYRVNLGARMLLFVLLLFFAAVDFLVIYRENILQGKVKGGAQKVFWILAASVLLSYLPYTTDYMNIGADSCFHLLRIEGLKETLLQGGQFPVRVESYWLYDHGYANSTFYGDLFLLIPALLRIIGFSLMTSYKMFVFAVMVATAWIAYYSFKRCTGSANAALFGAVIYTLAPYRIYNVYNRGAVGEYLGMIFIPLVLCGLYGLYKDAPDSEGYKKHKIPLIVGFSCLLQSHLLTCEMMVVFTAVICLAFWRKTFQKTTFMQLLQVAFGCLLLNIWFWLPLLWMMAGDSYVLTGSVTESIQERGTLFAELFQFFPNMGGGQEGMYQAEPFQVGITVTLMVLCVCLVILGGKKRRETSAKRNSLDGDILFMAGMEIVILLMSTRYFLWDLLGRIPVLGVIFSSIQFPTRMMGMASALGAFFAAFFIIWAKEELENGLWKQGVASKLFVGIQSVLLILTIGTSVYHVNDIVYRNDPVWIYNAENIGTVSIVCGEYLLAGTHESQYYYHGPVAQEGLEWSNYEKKGLDICLDVQNKTETEKYLELPLTGYKGYRVECSKDKELPRISDERGNHGDLRVAVPAGYEGTLEVSYEGFGCYRVAEVISLTTIIGICLYAMYHRRMQWTVKKK